MTDLGELVVRIKADASQLERELKKAQGNVQTSASGMEKSLESLKGQLLGLLPALSVAAFVQFGRGALDAAGRLQDLSDRTGFAASTLSALNIPLQQSGSNVEEFAAAMNLMNNSIGLAASGNAPELVKKFDELGLSVRKLAALNTQDQFNAIAAALGKIDNQADFISQGRGLFGRNFASIGPIIRAIAGDLDAFAESARKAGDAITDEDIKKVDDFGDAWTREIERVKVKLVEGAVAFDDFMKKGREVGDSLPSFADRSAQGIDHFGNKIPGFESWEDKTKRAGGVTEAKFGPLYNEKFGPQLQDKSARGGNADLLPPGKTNQVKEYISDLQRETTALGLSERALAIEKAVIDAEGKAREDRNNKLRASPELTDAERVKVEQLTGAFYDLKKAQEENARIARKMKEELSDALADIAVNFDNLKNSATSAIQSIAKEIIKAKITNPLSASIIDAIPSFSFGKLLGFASGGNPPVGVPSIVGENGPELFVPNTSGTIIPNGKMSGSSVVVQQTINLSPGLPETVNAAILQAAPHIAGMAHASVVSAIQNGGSESRIVGRRS
jgi:hypothetical protein